MRASPGELGQRDLPKDERQRLLTETAAVVGTEEPAAGRRRLRVSENRGEQNGRGGDFGEQRPGAPGMPTRRELPRAPAARALLAKAGAGSTAPIVIECLRACRVVLAVAPPRRAG